MQIKPIPMFSILPSNCGLFLKTNVVIQMNPKDKAGPAIVRTAAQAAARRAGLRLMVFIARRLR
jgi:hypothetical protein